MKRKICIVTGTRAEWGLLSNLAAKIRDAADLELQIVATNMHLSEEFGLTYREIENDGFPINVRVPILSEKPVDSVKETAYSFGRAVPGLADAFEQLKPDLIVLLGDRYEILAAACCALLFNIPIAHIHGGELTFGAYDDSIRHAITKMSSLHFAATEEYRKRIIQMGEAPDRVFYTGAPGVENIRQFTPLSKGDLEKSLNFRLGDKSLLVTYHPVTRENNSAVQQCGALLDALDQFPEYRIIFTQSNSDAEGRLITGLLRQYVGKDPERLALFASLGKTRYLSALRYVDAAVGNSSSGIVEVPSFGIPTLNIGNRQEGRMAAKSVLHCGNSTKEIVEGIRKIRSDDFRAACRSVGNPYEKTGTTDAILQTIRTVPLDALTKKRFFDLNIGNL